jgi:hypothetical protein
MALTKATYAMVQGAPINVFDYMTPDEIANITSNTGTTDVAAKIRLALDDAAVRGGVVYFPPGTYYVPSTIMIPVTSASGGVTGQPMHLLGYKATLKGAGAVTQGSIFESGAENYSTGGTSNWLQPDEACLHRQQIIEGFQFREVEYGMRLKNFINQCVVTQCSADATVYTLVYAFRCFYCAFTYNQQRAALPSATYARFKFQGFVNVETIYGNIAGNSAQSAGSRGYGFWFSGGTSGFCATNNAAENLDEGLRINGAVYGGLIHGWYFEGNSTADIVIADANAKRGLTIDGCWMDSANGLTSVGWYSGEFGKGNYITGTVDASSNDNYATFWLPRVLSGNAGATEYNLSIIPASWNLAKSCQIKTQLSSYIDASGPSSPTSALANDYFGTNLIVPRHYVGQGGSSKLPYCLTDSTTLGQITIDTKIVFSSNPSSVRFDLKATDASGSYILCGWVNDTTVLRDDAVGGKTIAASNNGGFYRLLITGLDPASAASVIGSVRIL